MSIQIDDIHAKRFAKFMACIVLILGVAFLLRFGVFDTSDKTYAVASERFQGRHYEYYTDSVCIVTNVYLDDTDCVVEVKRPSGQLYSFYADDPDLVIGNKVTVTFNETNQIVSVK